MSVSSRDQAKQETREALLRAALALIPQRGLDVSLDDICDRAGYTRGAFYVHFEGRDALLAAVMERVGRHVLDALIGATGQDDDLAGVVARFLQGLSTGAYPLTRAGGVRPYQLLDACARSPATSASSTCPWCASRCRASPARSVRDRRRAPSAATSGRRISACCS